MHHIEPHYNWRNLYVASEDEQSPFYGREYSEFEFTHSIYDHYLHPQWDEIGSPTLFIKILYVNYDNGTVVMEFIGEWNDCINNDIMHLKRNVIEELMAVGINKFVLIGENVLIFHSSDDCYYEEWYEELACGWIALINFKEHVLWDMQAVGLFQYVAVEDSLYDLEWRTFNPDALTEYIDRKIMNRLPA